MGNSWSTWLDVLQRGEPEGAAPGVPAMVRRVFEQYADDNGVMTSKALLKFFKEYQEDKGVLQGPQASMLLSFPSTSAKPGDAPAHHALRSSSQRSQPQKQRQSRQFPRYSMTLGGSRLKAQAEPNPEQFLHVLLIPSLTPALPSRVWQDMRAPLSHYYIYTGHNSYLKGNQLTSDSSVKPIVKALKRGVRVIELDLWPSSDRTEILVMHGGTLTRPVGFMECIEAIKANAFVASDYPVIITLEDHLPPSLQAIAAQVMSEVLGDLLYYPDASAPHNDFPSPFALRGRILISTQPPKGPKELSTVVTPQGSFREAAHSGGICSPCCCSPRARAADVARDSSADVASSSAFDPARGSSAADVARGPSGADVACNSHAAADVARGQRDFLSFRDLAQVPSESLAAAATAHHSSSLPVHHESSASPPHSSSLPHSSSPPHSSSLPHSSPPHSSSLSHSSPPRSHAQAGESEQADTGTSPRGTGGNHCSSDRRGCSAAQVDTGQRERAAGREREGSGGATEAGAGREGAAEGRNSTTQHGRGRSSFSFPVPVVVEGGEAEGEEDDAPLGAALSMAGSQRRTRGSGASRSVAVGRSMGSPSRGSFSGITWGSMGHGMGHSMGHGMSYSLSHSAGGGVRGSERSSGRSIQLHQVNERELMQVEDEWSWEDAAEAAEDALTAKVPQYRRLISIPGGKLKGGSVEEGLRACSEGEVRRISLSETQLATAARTVPHALISFTQRHLLRIYPFGLRVTSSNYDPMQAWLHGAQMVAMNMQGYGHPLWLVHGFFQANGGCGYVKKPHCLMGGGHGRGGRGEGGDGEIQGDVRGGRGGGERGNRGGEGEEVRRWEAGKESVPYDPQAPRPVELVLRVHVVLATGWYTRYAHSNFDAGAPSLLCRVAVEGAAADERERRLEVRVGEWNPSWDDTPLLFPLTLPQLALLCFEVRVLGLSSSCYPFLDYLFEKNMYQDDFGGQVVLPVMSLQPGFRCVPLYDREGRPMAEEQTNAAEGPRLLCQFELLKPGEEHKEIQRVPKSTTWAAGASSSNKSNEYEPHRPRIGRSHEI